MSFKFIFLSTDILLWLLMLVMTVMLFRARNSEHMQLAWQRITAKRLSVVAMVLFSFFIMIALLDSIHYQTNDAFGEVNSVFDRMVQHLTDNTEETYSAPFAFTSYTKETVLQPNGSYDRIFPRLQHAGLNENAHWTMMHDLVWRSMKSILYTILASIGFTLIFLVVLRHHWRLKSRMVLQVFKQHTGYFPWPAFFLTIYALFFFVIFLWQMSLEYHVFGTDKVGNDVLYLTLKSIRTGIVIGTLTTLMMLPFAIGLGITAGYYGGVLDDFIQYLYTTLSSVPGVLLIAASVLSLQVFITNHANWFPSIAERADAKLLALCAILGITSWTSLCRLLRAETMKLRNIDYVLAARSLGTSSVKILYKHILPNVFHLVLIAVVLDFSMLVLAEAVLSYVGVGVDPSMVSWGNMINSARLELARDPIVWWPLLSVFIFMFILVLCSNLFADAVRDGLDPR